MIAAIADDLTGAAEIGGVALRHALTAEVQTGRYRRPCSDVVVLDTDSRSMKRDRSQASVRNAARAVEPIDAELIYKKVDSAMRGNLMAEIETLLVELAKDRALLIPANPTLRRTIRNGKYFVGGIPLHDTDFSRDLEHPIRTSEVLDLLGESESFKARVFRNPQPIPCGTIAIGEAESLKDLLAWASCLAPSCLAAGASDFFAAMLKSRGFRMASAGRERPSQGGEKSLYVCGSRSDYSHQALGRAKKLGLPIAWMPQGILQGNPEKHMNAWVENASRLLKRHSLVIVALGDLPDSDPALAHRLRDYTAALVKKVLHKAPVEQLYVEGGATSSGIVAALEWTRFFPVEELSRGVVRMKIDGCERLHITMKPGSYPWPEGMLLHSWDEA